MNMTPKQVPSQLLSNLNYISVKEINFIIFQKTDIIDQLTSKSP